MLIIMSSSLEIVQSVPDDAGEIGIIRATNWKEQYAKLDGVTPEWMDDEIKRISGAEGTRERAYWIEQARKPDAHNYWLTARIAGSLIIGFLEARKHENGTQELRSLHLDLAAKQAGKGVGQVLIDEVHGGWFDPAMAIYLDVAEVNVGAQRFYQRPPNNYSLTEHRFMYGPIRMRQMIRPPRS